MPPIGHDGSDPEYCEEYGYGIGTPEGILLLKYRSAGGLTMGEGRDDFLHQLYWSPDGMLATAYGSSLRFVGSGEAFWARRAVSHDVHAGSRQTVYRICLREIPPALHDLRSGPVTLDEETARLIETITRRGCEERAALAIRARILARLRPAPTGTAPTGRAGSPHARGGGFALSVAHALSHDPADPTSLGEWAARQRVSVKTLQRDFVREFGMPYSQWRTRLRLRAARVLLEAHPVTKVAHRVGYASPSAFITAFSKEYGQTPGDYVTTTLRETAERA